MATTQEALQLTTVVPSFTADDLQKSISFYEALGFAVSERWEDKGILQGVMLRAGKSEIGLSQDDWKKGRDRQKGVGLRLLLSTTQNVDEVAARAKSAGITLNRSRSTASGRLGCSRSSTRAVSCSPSHRNQPSRPSRCGRLG